jgi:phosphate transport system substrate-binding protein
MFVRRLLVSASVLGAIVSGCQPAMPPSASAPDLAAEPAVRVSGSGAALPLVQKLAAAYSRQHPADRFAFDAGTNSGGGIRGVVQGTLDIGVVNRPLSEAEASDGLNVQPFAKDAVVFAAQTASSVRGLSTADVQDVYGGVRTDWEQLGGARGLILILDRDPDEPQRSQFLLPLLDGRPVQARTIMLTSVPDMLQTLEGTPNSLGYTTLTALRIRQAKQVRVLALDGVVPGREALLAGTYPWYLTYSLVTRPEAPPAVERFLAFVRSPEGQTALAEYDAAAPSV